MRYNIEFQISALVFLIIIMVVYFQKNHNWDRDNRCFARLTVFAAPLIIDDIICPILLATPAAPEIWKIITGKLYIILMFQCLFQLMQYTICLSLGKNDTGAMSVLYRLTPWLGLAFGAISLCLPLTYYSDGVSAYVHGPCQQLCYIVGAMLAVGMPAIIIAHRRRIPFRKQIPIYTYVLLEAATALLENVNKEILLTSLSLSITIAIIYFTLQNPDIAELEAYRRDSFINGLLQFGMTAESPDVKLRKALEYLGTKLKNSRIVICNPLLSYEWKVGEAIISDEMIENLHSEIKGKGCLRVNGVLVAELDIDGAYAGFIALEGLNNSQQIEIEEVAPLLSYYFSQLLVLRRDRERLLHHSYHDALTGTKNRRAFEEYERKELDTSRSYGYVMCDINGLKNVNDIQGHGAGDMLIKDVAEALTSVFGQENVYRMGGDEFAVYAYRESEAALIEDAGKVRRIVAEKGHSAAIGAVFCAGGAVDKAQADQLMYEEKRKYYQEHAAANRRKI